MAAEAIMISLMLWMIPSALFASWLMSREKAKIRVELGTSKGAREELDTFEIMVIILIGLCGPIGAASAYLCHCLWFGTWKA